MKSKKNSEPKVKDFLEDSGDFIYYFDLTDELFLHKRKIRQKMKITLIAGKLKMNFGGITYIGEL
jgi:hypothetical protein